MKILIISLGCDKNLVDTEKMIGLLSERGYEFTDDEAEAEAVIVNTCCFIGDAKEESINTLLEMGELRKSGKIKALIASGCLSERLLVLQVMSLFVFEHFVQRIRHNLILLY
ncbi:MAG: hypothetical protein IKN35_03245, partial [Lachnospiraceae bacterium]|nr:hypothetical protein [Lachnospiraceae bacterium]